MAPPPDYDKDGMADTFSERTYHPDGSPYNIELNKLRSQMPDAQATRPKSMEYGYNPRYDGINNAPASGSSNGIKRAEKVFATLCCSSCLCFFIWILASLLVIAAFTVLLVKVVHPPTTASPVLSATYIPAIEPSTITVIHSTPSAPFSAITAPSIITDTTTFTSIATMTSVSIATQTYTPSSPATITVTSQKDGTTFTSIQTTSVIPTPPSVTTETETTVATTSVPTTASITNISTAITVSVSVSSTTAVSTVTASNNDNNDNNGGNDHVKSGSSYQAKPTFSLTPVTTSRKPLINGPPSVSTTFSTRPPSTRISPAMSASPKSTFVCKTQNVGISNVYSITPVGLAVKTSLSSARAANAPQSEIDCYSRLYAYYNSQFVSDQYYCASVTDAKKIDTARCA